MRLTILSFRSLTQRKVRTALCLLGIALGVMVSLSVGTTTMAYTTALREMNIFFQGKIVVTSKGTLFIQALPIGGFLPERIAEEVEKIGGVEEAVPMLAVIDLSLKEGEGGGLSQFIPMNISFGIAEGRWEVLVGSTPLSAGRWPAPSSDEVVIGNYLSERDNLAVGSEVKVGEYNLKVVGILDTPSPFLARLVIMPLETTQKIYGYPMLINMIVVKPKGSTTEEDLANSIALNTQGVSVLTSDARQEFSGPLFRDVELWNLGLRTAIYLISLVLVATVTTINISERRRELATLDAIGAAKSFILRMVTLEGAVLSFLGGLMGIFLGSIASILLVSHYASIPLSMIFRTFFDVVRPILTLEILASTVAVSIAASALPALMALRTNIIDALRSEN
jgi:putative ABC transport system permease protein